MLPSPYTAAPINSHTLLIYVLLKLYKTTIHLECTRITLSNYFHKKYLTCA